jgi:hydrophobic/amphiphilic exporter-1 (mainly G- bacteria), HAE1 family
VQWLAELSIRRPVLASVLVLSLVVVGGFAYFELGVDRSPRVDVPVVVVTITQPGASPEDVETEITARVERALNTISGIDLLRSTSTEGVSQVTVEFQLEKNGDIAAQEVRDKVSQILVDLPRNIDPPIVLKTDPDAAPVLYLSLAADGPIRELTELADKTVRRELESLPGVGEVQIIGGRLRQINLWLDPARLRAYRLTAAEVARAIDAQNVQLPGGTMTQGPRELMVRMKGRVESVRELETLVVAARDGTPIRLADVADVEDGMKAVETAANIDDRAAVILALRRQSGTNTVAVVDGVRERLRSI